MDYQVFELDHHVLHYALYIRLDLVRRLDLRPLRSLWFGPLGWTTITARTFLLLTRDAPSVA